MAENEEMELLCSRAAKDERVTGVTWSVESLSLSVSVDAVRGAIDGRLARPARSFAPKSKISFVQDRARTRCPDTYAPGTVRAQGIKKRLSGDGRRCTSYIVPDSQDAPVGTVAATEQAPGVVACVALWCRMVLNLAS